METQMNGAALFVCIHTTLFAFWNHVGTLIIYSYWVFTMCFPKPHSQKKARFGEIWHFSVKHIFLGMWRLSRARRKGSKMSLGFPVPQVRKLVAHESSIYLLTHRGERSWMRLYHLKLPFAGFFVAAVLFFAFLYWSGQQHRGNWR